MSDDYTTREVAQMLGLAVRSVQLMVDRGELQAWKTPGGHRRISRSSVQQWRASRGAVPADPGPAPAATDAGALLALVAAPRSSAPPASATPAADGASVLLIEDSIHYQNLLGLLLRQSFPEVVLHVADDGIAGLAMAGALKPDVLVVDILLPGIDGGALITSLRSHPQFAATQLIVVTSLDEAQRAPYAFALAGVPVVHKPRLVLDFPPLLRQGLVAASRNRLAAGAAPVSEG